MFSVGFQSGLPPQAVLVINADCRLLELRLHQFLLLLSPYPIHSNSHMDLLHLLKTVNRRAEECGAYTCNSTNDSW